MEKLLFPTQLTRDSEQRRRLLEKREQALLSLGTKFDTLAKMGRVAEEDRAPVLHDEFISLHVNSLDHEQLILIEEALERLDAGEYGICLHCRRPISKNRLEAIPWARYCIHCQSELAAGTDELAEGVGAG
jgi:RNA polymerase-binding transcription factor